ncbi:MAG: YggU family protein [Elusimicrobia bacterium CG06_land_8_20_14_3_00_38_11]|nr:MAG: YggU family protein [Elusimicrobia bacterium CG06_land_8_20_14_3_00_38_11]
MILQIKVIPNARKNDIKFENALYKVYITAPAVDGKANKKLIEFLAEHFKVRKNEIFIKRGEKSRHKIIQINEQ